MPINHPAPQLFKLLADDLRWQLLSLLAGSDLRVQELSELSGQPQNLVSYHLSRLARAGMVREQRSIADGREVYYSLDGAHVRELFQQAGQRLHPAFFNRQASTPPAQPRRVLFLCTHNSARSQMAESLMNSSGRGWVQASSAGTSPSRIHPLTVQVLAEKGLDLAGARAKPLAVFKDQAFDTIVTVCDRARRSSAEFPASSLQLHWSLPDPLEVTGSRAQRLAAFRSVANELDSRIAFFLSRLQVEQAE